EYFCSSYEGRNNFLF
nr:immunoglobulin light chain junction region [Macaca mulatta]